MECRGEAASGLLYACISSVDGPFSIRVVTASFIFVSPAAGFAYA